MLNSWILRCWTRELHHLWTRSSKIPTSRKRSVWRNRKLRKRVGSFAEDRSLTWSTTTFESLVLIIQFLIMPIYSLSLFATMMFRILIRDGTKFYCRCQKIHPMISWKVCTKLRVRESDQLKTELELFDMEIHQKISMPDYQKLKTMVKRIIDQKRRSRKFGARNERIETGAVVTSRRGISGVEKRQGVCYQWKAKGQCSKGDSFWHDSDERAKSTPKHEPSLWTGISA